MTLKVAILTEYVKIGGGETNAINLAYSLMMDLNVDVTLIAYGEVIARANQLGIKTLQMNLSGKRWFRFVPIIKRNDRFLCAALDDFDIVHAYSVNLLPRLYFIKSARIIWTNHGYWEGAKNLRLKIMMMLLGVRKIIGVNSEVYGNLKIDDSKKIKIPLGLLLRGLPLNTSKKNVIKIREIKIGCIARFQKIKGQDLLVQAMQTVAIKFNEINFTVDFIGGISEGDESAENYQKSVRSSSDEIEKKYPNIRFNYFGYQKNVQAYYGKLDIVVVPSRYESFSMVCIEALSNGLPVIAPDVGGPKEIINSNKIGILFKAGSVVELDKAIVEALNRFNEFEMVSCINRANDFDIKNQAKLVFQAYQDVLEV